MNAYCVGRFSRGEPITPHVAMGHVLFSVGLLNYAYHHERQKMEQAIAHLPSR